MEHDYRQNGTYFVTICAKDRHELFGRIEDGKMILSENGEAVQACIERIEEVYRSVRVNASVVMPNHVHLLISFMDYRKNPALQTLIAMYKAAVLKHASFSPWQDRAYVRIVFTNNEYQNVLEYIRTNPSKWVEDRFFTGLRHTK